jgi:hypothetical protein
MTTVIKPTKFRLHLWLNTETRQEEYGIQSKIGNRWTHCSENGKPLIFPVKADAIAKMMELSNGNPHGTLRLPRVI